MYKTLSEYIAALERAGELVRVNVPVDPVLEIAELTDREAKSPGGGRALLFENTGTPFPVLTNMMGSDRRIAMALGVESVDLLTGRIEELFAALTSPRPDLFDKLRMLPLLGRMSRWLPREVKGRGVCQQVVLQGAVGPVARAEMLAAGRRAFRDAAVGAYARSGYGSAQCGHVPDAAFFAADDRNALAPAQDRRASLPGLPETRKADARDGLSGR